MLAITICLLAACDANSLPVPAATGANPPSVASVAPPPKYPTVTAAIGVNNRPLLDAATKTRQSKLYRVTFNFVMSAGEDGQVKSQPFLAFDGEINGETNRILYNGGAFNEMLGGGNRIEMISIPNKTYLKGTDLYGTTDAGQWYVLPDSGITKPPFDVDDMLLLTGDDFSAAKTVGVMSVDGQACQQWLLDFRARAGALLDMTGADTTSDINVVDSAEARFTACADGYLHAMQWHVTTHSASHATDTGALAIAVRLFDFDAQNIIITAPDGAIELR